jgi:hypothetical protein
MATLSQLTKDGKLFKHVADLEPQELPERFIYFAPAFERWLCDILPTLPRDRGRDLSPLEQVEALFYDFVVKRPMVYGQTYRKLEPLTAHVWELKSEDIRVFGWFARRATFVAVVGQMKKHIKPRKLYDPFIDATRVFREALDLDPPKELTGVIYHDIL